MKNTSIILTRLGLLTIVIVSVIVSVLMNGWVLSILWGWFISPLFGLPPLSVASAIGLALIFGMFMRTDNLNEDKTKNLGEMIVFLVAQAVLSPLFTLFVGWIVKQYI